MLQLFRMAENDNQLLNKIKAGDYNAFGFLFNRYYGLLCNYALRFVRDDFISEDIVQEVFVKIWESRAKLKIIGSVKSYLYIAVKNKSINKLQSEAVRQKYTSNFFSYQSKEVSQTELEQEEFRNHLFNCIQKLPPRCHDVFTKSRFNEMKQEQIAQKMDISLKTVKAQIGKALRFIQSCLKIQYPEFI
jgi:RNA polymerase sigma-70 factor (ECF subfamily)